MIDYNAVIQLSILIIFSAMAINSAKHRISEKENGWVKLGFGLLVTVTVDVLLYCFNVFTDRPFLWVGLVLLAGTLITIYLIIRPLNIIKPKE